MINRRKLLSVMIILSIMYLPSLYKITTTEGMDWEETSIEYNDDNTIKIITYKLTGPHEKILFVNYIFNILLYLIILSIINWLTDNSLLNYI